MSLVIALLLANSSAHPPAFPTRLGECQWVHGEYISANGSGLRRIWVIGTKHVLNLHDWDEDVPDRRFSLGYFPPAVIFRGDFYACALAKFSPGAMQPVRLKAVRRLTRVKNEDD